MQHVNQKTGRREPLRRRAAASRPVSGRVAPAFSTETENAEQPLVRHTATLRQADATPPNQRPYDLPLGGDSNGCLSASDIDNLLNGITALPASAFFHWRRGMSQHADLFDELHGLTKPALFIVHVRYHWVATQLTTTEWRIWDSAPSLLRDSRRLGLPRPTFLPSPRQRHGSMECGLFAAAFILMVNAGHQIPGDEESGRKMEVSFSPLRQHLVSPESFLSTALEILGIQVSLPTHNHQVGSSDTTRTKDPCFPHSQLNILPLAPTMSKASARHQQNTARNAQIPRPTVTYVALTSY